MFLQYSTAKDHYYQVLRAERYKPILLTCPELARPATEEEVAALHHAEVLRPDGKSTRTVEDAQLGTIEMTFEAEE